MSGIIPIAADNPFDLPTIITGSGGFTLPSTTRYVCRVTPSSGLSISVPSGRSHRLQNEGTISFLVSGVSTATYTVEPGDDIEFYWTGSAHEVQVTKAAVAVAPTWIETGHGLVTADVGKALSGSAIWSPSDGSQVFSGVLRSVPATSSFTLYVNGDTFAITTALIEGGSFVLSASTRLLWWNGSKYQPTQPTTSAGGSPPALMVLSESGGTLSVMVINVGRSGE